MSADQPSAYLFEETASAAMERFLDRGTLFAFDLDGTLAPIISDPVAIGIPAVIRDELDLLNDQAAVAVITGRARSDALQHLAFTPRYLIGNHGAEGLPGWETQENEFNRNAKKWQSQLDVLLPIKDRAGIVIENKGATLSIHYRHAGSIKAAHALILRTIDRLVPQPRRIGGKYVENLIPKSAPDKGIALRLLMHRTGCVKSFFVGDDETDEDVFCLTNKNIFTVRVGLNTTSRARFHLQNQREIARLLRDVNHNLAQISP